MDRMKAADTIGDEPRSAWQWGRAGRAGRSWILGTGLLSFHVGLYLLTAVALVLLNLYRSPGHLWVQQVLLPWGIVVVVHAVLVGVSVTLANAQQMIEPGEDAAPGAHAAGRGYPTAPRPSGRFSVRPVATVIDNGPQWQRASRFVRDRVILPTSTKAATTTASVRSRLADRRRTGPGADNSGPAAAWPKATPASRANLDRARAVLTAGGTRALTLASTIQSSTRSAVAQSRARLNAGRGGAAPDSSQGGPDHPSGPASAWPTMRPPAAPSDAGRDAGNRPNPWGPAASPPPPRPAADDRVTGAATPAAEPTASTRAGDAGPSSDTESTWMEAAAAAWLARQKPAHDGDGSDTAAQTSPPRA